MSWAEGSQYELLQTFEVYSYLIDDEITNRMRVMIERHPFLVDIQLNGESALHVAARNGDVRRMNMLIDAGFDINATNRARQIPLICALTENLHIQGISTFKALLARGADMDLFNQHADIFFPSGPGVLRRNTGIKRLAFIAIQKMENQIDRCRSSVLTFVLCCKKTGLIHPNVGSYIIAKTLLWPTRRLPVWGKVKSTKKIKVV